MSSYFLYKRKETVRPYASRAPSPLRRTQTALENSCLLIEEDSFVQRGQNNLPVVTVLAGLGTATTGFKGSRPTVSQSLLLPLGLLFSDTGKKLKCSTFKTKCLKSA